MNATEADVQAVKKAKVMKEFNKLMSKVLPENT
jgi:hypothetical protein